jgi:mannose-6-phosphate isomerase-like protein (cupin superfamily)
MFVPPGVPHSAENIGDGEARLVEIYTPPGADFVEV